MFVEAQHFPGRTARQWSVRAPCDSGACVMVVMAKVLPSSTGAFVLDENSHRSFEAVALFEKKQKALEVS